MFYYIISTTYQKIGDLFWPDIFLDFRTVCLKDIFFYFFFLKVDWWYTGGNIREKNHLDARSATSDLVQEVTYAGI